VSFYKEGYYPVNMEAKIVYQELDIDSFNKITISPDDSYRKEASLLEWNNGTLTAHYTEKEVFDACKFGQLKFVGNEAIKNSKRYSKRAARCYI